MQDNKIKVKQMTRRAIQISSYVIWPMMIGMCVVAEPFIRLILTEKWVHCVSYMQIFCISYGLYPIHTANLEALKAIGRSDLYLLLEITKKIIGFTILFASIPFGPKAIALSGLISGICSCFINGAPNVELLNYSFKEQFSDLLGSFVIAVIMGACIFPISLLPLSDFVIMTIQVVSGIIAYVLISIITKQQSFYYLSNIIFKRLKKRED